MLTSTPLQAVLNKMVLVLDLMSISRGVGQQGGVEVEHPASGLANELSWTAPGRGWLRSVLCGGGLLPGAALIAAWRSGWIDRDVLTRARDRPRP
ncbi:hypothetical protein [Dactylosporangium sp. NPDC006015]|uniref:hypothetical protein n=1 Tax=Dactylosporangium sp. NPDC006015 TaxID=3154576 RepID=UPI0033A51CD4